MDLAEADIAVNSPRWDATLALEYAWRDGRTVLARREHRGPLRVQRDLYPEGADTCHTIIVHPPGGVAGGDTLAIDTRVGELAAALLTTPGAGKWYRSSGLSARQTLSFEIAGDASLEWLPQETIVFDGADARLHSTVRMAAGGVYLGWEILCLGRQASGEGFTTGRLQLNSEIWRGDDCLWIERGSLMGGGALLDSPVGLDGHRVCATLVAAGRDISNEVTASCRGVSAGFDAHAGITRLPYLLIARWLGDSSEDAKHYLLKLWALLRPALRNRTAVIPRIWAT